MSEAPAMKITILTIFPEMFESVLNSSILGRARAQGILDIRCVDIRPFSDRKHKNTDDYPFGGGAGMVMLAQPIMDAMRSVTGEGFCGRRKAWRRIESLRATKRHRPDLLASAELTDKEKRLLEEL